MSRVKRALKELKCHFSLFPEWKIYLKFTIFRLAIDRARCNGYLRTAIDGQVIRSRKGHCGRVACKTALFKGEGGRNRPFRNAKAAQCAAFKGGGPTRT